VPGIIYVICHISDFLSLCSYMPKPSWPPWTLALTIYTRDLNHCCIPSTAMLPTWLLWPSTSCSQAYPSASCYFEYERDTEKLWRSGQHFFCLWLPYEMIHHYCQLGHLPCFTKESIKGPQFVSIRSAGYLAATGMWVQKLYWFELHEYLPWNVLLRFFFFT